MKILLTVVFVIILSLNNFSQNIDPNDLVMRSTCQIIGFEGNTGTGFFIQLPTRPGSDYYYPVFITAKHVLDDIKQDSAVLLLRKKKNDIFEIFPFTVNIRKQDTLLYFSHPTADIAAINIKLPSQADILLIPIEYFADENILKEGNFHSGTELNCLGYPLGQWANFSGFPILRSGKIASYPIYPVNSYRTFLIDISVFKGNSGGPVYYSFDNPYGAKVIVQDVKYQRPSFAILGLISKEKIWTDEHKTPYTYSIDRQQLALAEVVHSTFIIETLNIILKTLDSEN